MFKIKKRCTECGEVLKDGICVNPNCVIVVLRDAEEARKKKEAEGEKP